MSNKQLSAGDHITAKCTKCKTTTNHTVVAMVGDKVARVQCNTCGGTHNYHNVADKKTSSRNTPSSPKPVKVNKTEAKWENLLDNADPADAIPYSMQMSVTPGALIQHPSFGLGRVINTIPPNKIEVNFRCGVKLLRCSIG